MHSRIPRSVLILTLLGGLSVDARAEGTAQLGAGQDVVQTTAIRVDILKAGEVINIAAGNDSATDAATVEVIVRDPSGAQVSGSPFTLKRGSAGFLDQPDKLPPSIITNPLRIITKVKGTYHLSFSNQRADLQGDDRVIDPLDISVTPDATTTVKPASPYQGLGRVHSQRWLINAHLSDKSAAINADFYVRVPLDSTSGLVYLLRLAGVAGGLVPVSGNGVGLPPPNSGLSLGIASSNPPEPQYAVYLKPPAAATIGNLTPTIKSFKLDSPSSFCPCVVTGGKNTFSFDSGGVGTYHLIIDLDQDNKFDPSRGDALVLGTAQAGTNTMTWDGMDSGGKAAKAGSYNARLHLRSGEFHFTATGVEVANPGIRIFRVSSLKGTSAARLMFWDDTRINDAKLLIDPASTLPGGRSSGTPTSPAQCSAPGVSSPNAHCWGSFSAPASDSPGGARYIDTWAYHRQVVSTALVCVRDGSTDQDSDGLTLAEECTLTKTNPNKEDTDGDGLTDGLERGKNPDGSSIPGANKTNPLDKDTDGDGLTDLDEDRNRNALHDATETDPNKADTDGDSLQDGLELGINPDGTHITEPSKTDPLHPDTDRDGLQDGVEDADRDGHHDQVLTNPSQGETSPTRQDTDGDGLPDGYRDLDKDGAWDAGEGEDRNNNGQVDAGETDPRLKDTDGGGESDGSEVLRTHHDPLVSSDDRSPEAGLFGGGCSAMGEGPALCLALALILLISLVLRIRWPVILCCVLLAGEARAAEPLRLPSVNFKPPASTINYLQTESAWTLPHLVPSIRLMMSYSQSPLEVVNVESGALLSAVVDYQVNMDICLAMGFWDRVELGLVIPLTMTQGGGDLQQVDHAHGATLEGGLGDLRIIPKVRIHTKGAGTLAVALPLSVPSGKEDAFLGESGVSFAPRIIFTIDTEFVDLSLNFGYLLRQDQSIPFSEAQKQVTIDDEVFGSIALSAAVWKDRVELIADIFASASVFQQDEEEIPVEVLGGIRARLPYGIVTSAGAGAGLTRGIGAPALRVFWSVGYQYGSIITPHKRARSIAEELAAYQPKVRTIILPPAGPSEPDGDGDRIPDVRDRCPAAREDRDGFKDGDGCPEPDNDHDGLLDRFDKCPLKPEDRDNFKDGDGCPDPDNDQDRVMDHQDRCPWQAEDRDGFEDQDGCPERDNDNDGIPDDMDACPNLPEYFNSFKDDDGCPDKGRGRVQIIRGQIMAPPLRFQRGRSRLLPWNKGTLRRVAKIILYNPWISKVRVEGHTDSRGRADRLLTISGRRAEQVREYLIKQGVDAGRLTAQGFGGYRPIANNRMRRGRTKNNRVDFVIVDPAQ